MMEHLYVASNLAPNEVLVTVPCTNCLSSPKRAICDKFHTKRIRQLESWQMNIMTEGFERARKFEDFVMIGLEVNLTPWQVIDLYEVRPPSLSLYKE